MDNPYATVNWDSVRHIGSATHMHMTDQATLDNAYKHGIRHFPMSNYYPSAPYNADTRPSDFRLRQHWPARMDNGEELAPPVNWNDVITWGDELDEPYRSELPFTEGERAFSRIPDDAMLSANAEHHGFTNSHAHICSPGSSFVSGNLDPKEHFHLKRHGFMVGFGGTWQEGFAGMLEGLDYADGGGITINHPTWFSRFPEQHVLDMLDFDPRVLGIEIYNDYSARRDWSKTPAYQPPAESAPGLSLNLWDRILATGRQCWGFSVPDHSVGRSGNWHGRSVLLVDELTEHACLKAYRQGQFCGCLKDNGLTITDFAATATSVSVKTNQPATIRFIIDAATAMTVEGESATLKLPPDLTYVRVEAKDSSGERLFLQPVTYRPRPNG